MRLVGLARRWRQALDAQLLSAGLTDASWTPLIHLQALGDGIPQRELAAAVGLDDSSLVRLLDILTDRGLVERRPDAHDRRIKLIFLTPEGRKTVKSIRTQLVKVEDVLLADIGDEDACAMTRAFDLIESRIEGWFAQRVSAK